MKKILTYFSIVLSIVIIIVIPAILYYLFPDTPTTTWIDFFGAYIGAIVGSIVAAILALVISNIEGEKQRKEFQEQLKEQKKTDTEVRNIYLKNKLILEKKSEVVYESMVLMQDIPKIHSFVFNSLDNNKNIDKNEFDFLEEKILVSVAKIGKNKAYIADNIELYQELLTSIFKYISNLKKFIPAEITREIEMGKDKELVEIDREELEEFVAKLKTETEKLKSKNKRSAIAMTNFIDMYLISENQVETDFEKTTKCLEKFYKAIDKSIYDMLQSF